MRKHATESSLVLMDYGNYLRAHSVYGNFRVKLHFSVKL